MEIPPPNLPPKPEPAVPKPDQATARGKTPDSAADTRTSWGRSISWQKLRESLHPGAFFGGMGTPFDLLEIFQSSVVQLVLRVLRVVFFLGIGVAAGWIALLLCGAEWRDISRPWKTTRDVLSTFESLEDVMAHFFMGVGLYALSFVACLRSIWIVPFALAGFLIQVLWLVRAMSEEDEEPWLLAAVVPVVSWQVFACVQWYSLGDLVVPILFLIAGTICWTAVFVINGWMRRSEMGLWDLIDTSRHRFDPAFHRWSPAAQPSRHQNLTPQPPTKPTPPE